MNRHFETPHRLELVELGVVADGTVILVDKGPGPGS
jgi:hypothetical protein